LAVVVFVSGVLAAVTPARAGASMTRSPMASAVSVVGGTWVILPMGILSDPNNTFWELFHSAPGSSHWSLVTPPGVADNGGLVAGASAGSALVGVLPSGLLRFSPLAQSDDGGTSWGPVYFPAGLAPLPDALAYQAAGPGGAVALTGGGRAVVAPAGLSSWSPLVSAAVLRRASPGCRVTALDAVAILPGGAPLVATGCGDGQVGIFTRSAGSWQSSGFELGGALRASATAVLRLQVTGATTTALVAATDAGRRALVALWRSGDAPWRASAPLMLKPGRSVLASSVSIDDALAVLLGASSGRSVAFDVVSGGTWSRLPPLPSRTTALAAPAGPSTMGSDAVDAFTVNRGSLGVFALTPSGTAWVRLQSSQIDLAYGSSS
jgi:hypothetical protein